MSHKSKPALWRRLKMSYVAMIAACILLAVSALPNLYPNKSWLHISLPDQTVTLQSVTTSLNQHGFEVTEANDSQAKLAILLAEPTQSANALSFIKTQYPQLEAKIVEHATSPQWLQQLGLSPIKLGLDLNGGVLFVLDVDLDKAMQEHLNSVYQQTKLTLRKDKIRGIRASEVKEGVELQILPSGEEQLAGLVSTLQGQFKGLMETKSTTNNLTTVLLHFNEQSQNEFNKQVMAQSLTTLRGRIEELGITEAVTQRQGKQRIRIELPGVQDPSEAKRIIGATATLDFYQVVEVGGKAFNVQGGGVVNLNPMAIFSGDHINNASVGKDEWGKPLVQLSLDSQGGDAMSTFSKHNIGKPMATVYSEYSRDANGDVVKKSEVINVANIAQHLSSRFSITNMKSPQAAYDLALLLRAGSLTAPVTIVQEQTIGPSLGSENIEHGLAALMLGIGITLAFMALWYRRLGLIANIALLLNLTALVGLMSLLPGVVLTLPGIAGLVLTIGMAVDTNVIIFERIKEEKRKGRPTYQAIEQGYNQAFTTILDANVTTMITAIILYAIGYGPVKGFAITLALGLLTSVFTGVYISKALSQTLYIKLTNLTGAKA
ncbi:protein translocase subunit SecD [Pseudoalteromonas shioyasakiensis]|uniref:Protein translocase subunit SecD n=1 Tax=Pseudoalteromonas shioyasakiensis TaxID=1190813 RepID=A0ABT6TVH3_9GAMM|nr:MULTISPECIES: protein translocase subunit SecD [Pseudoalteromonas]MDI4667903.1 protein translocase subunit SecD [Pseudoalteromonas shioyasakiensis]MDI4672867.1 protein translocase subunit SecD [Pseudoalteromonas shioyasakiensis]MDI4684931.1 protein translocase subunit SecD [Pseudoalteromonas shioyasakiensis]MDI4703105.1 protein translocase subunit SecD [Pseudoalteromonas shioyasakiensis]NUJ20268.1 protein translocase subunit SecD [Pseudoalteromonas sp. 0802]